VVAGIAISKELGESMQSRSQDAHRIGLTGFEGSEGRDIDDCTTLLCHHDRCDLSSHGDHTHHIHLETLPPYRIREIEWRCFEIRTIAKGLQRRKRCATMAHVVHDSIDPAIGT